MKVHYLKTHPPFFRNVISGNKPFEIRKNDRDYAVGDVLILQEYLEGHYSGHEYTVIVTYLTNFPDGLREGFVCMGIRPCPISFGEP